MRAKFVRGQDPRDAMGIGDVGWRGIESTLADLKQNHGGEWSIQDKEPDNLIHYLEGEWITKEGWKFYLLYDLTEDAFSLWYVMTGDRDEDSLTIGKDTLEEAKEWIELQYKSKKDGEEFDRFMMQQNRNKK